MHIDNVEGWKGKWKGKGKGKGEGKGKGTGFQGGFRGKSKGRGKGRGGNWKGTGKCRGYGRSFGRGKGKGRGKSYGKYNQGTADGVCRYCHKCGHFEAQCRKKMRDLGRGDLARIVEGDQESEDPSRNSTTTTHTGKVPTKGPQVDSHHIPTLDNLM